MAFEFKYMQKWGRHVGRAGMSEAALKAVSECDGSYKDVMRLCGRLKAIAQAAGCDIYWSEQVNRGYRRQLYSAQDHSKHIGIEADRIKSRLGEYYTPEETDRWLSSPHPQLEGALPADLIARGEHNVVHQVLDRLDSGGYL